MRDDFGVNNGGATPDIGSTEKAADGVPAGKRRCLGDFTGWYCIAIFGWTQVTQMKEVVLEFLETEAEFFCLP